MDVAAAPKPASAERSDKVEAQSLGANSGEQLKYHFTGYKKFLDPDGYPAVAPPWGTLNAIDLNTGKYLWKIPFGQYPELVAKGMTQHRLGKLRRPDRHRRRPAHYRRHQLRPQDPRLQQRHRRTALGGRSAFRRKCDPATYMVDGKQYIVIATSGARDKKSPQGAAYVAFALP